MEEERRAQQRRWPSRRRRRGVVRLLARGSRARRLARQRGGASRLGHRQQGQWRRWPSTERDGVDAGMPSGVGNGATHGGDADGCAGMQWRWPGSRAARGGTAGIDRVLRDKGRFCCLKVRWCCGKEKEEARGQRQTGARGQGAHRAAEAQRGEDDEAGRSQRLQLRLRRIAEQRQRFQCGGDSGGRQRCRDKALTPT